MNDEPRQFEFSARLDSQSATTPYRVPVYIGCTVLALVINYLIGKEMAWDMLHYHVYAGFSALNDRFAQDYFAAGPQSYFNPYAYVPFYLLANSGLSSLEVSSILAVAQSGILWLTYELALSVSPSHDPHTRLVFGLCGVALASINPVLIQQFGSSFADITTGELVLAGWLLIAYAIRAPRALWMICAGILLGAATALKPTNAVHAVAAFAMIIMLPLRLGERIRHGITAGVALALSFVVVSAPWSYRLESSFGNPLFPLMNNVFRSPEFTTEPLRHFRFIPATVAETLWRPFAMIDPITMVHEELRAPDLRYAVLTLLLGALFCRWLWQCYARVRTTPPSGAEAISSRILAAIIFALGVDWVLWLSVSGNSRYFLPMSSVAAVVLAAILFRLFAAHPKARNYIIAAIFGVQAIQLLMGTDFRWSSVPWDNRWIRLIMPAKLASESDLYLTIGAQSNSFIAPYLASTSGLINISGGYALAPDGATGARIKTLIGRYAPHLRVLLHGERLYRDGEHRLPTQSQIDGTLWPFGLRVDSSDCETITVQGLPPDLEFTTGASRPAIPQSRDRTYLVSCKILPDQTDHSKEMERRRTIDLVLDRLEDSCPALFQPRRMETEYNGRMGERRYLNTDLTAWVSNGSLKFMQPSQGGDIKYLGRENDWARSPLQINCGRRNGIFFASVVESTPKQ